VNLRLTKKEIKLLKEEARERGLKINFFISYILAKSNGYVTLDALKPLLEDKEWEYHKYNFDAPKHIQTRARNLGMDVSDLIVTILREEVLK